VTAKTCICCVLIAATTAVPESHGSPSSAILKSLARYGTKESASASAEAIAKKVPTEMAERVGMKIMKEGGEQSLDRVVLLSAEHGPEVVRAIDNAPSAAPILRALEELPVEDVSKAAARLAAGAQGKEIAALTVRYGSSVLRAEAVHPGIGHKFVRALGTDGATMSHKLTPSQAIHLGRYVDDIGALPSQQRSSLLALIRSDAERFCQFLARFAENNPGKSLFTVAGTTIILAEPERILGGDEIVLDASGNPILLSKPGLAGRTTAAVSDGLIRPIISICLPILAAFLGVYAFIKLLGVWRRERRRNVGVLEGDVKK